MFLNLFTLIYWEGVGSHEIVHKCGKQYPSFYPLSRYQSPAFFLTSYGSIEHEDTRRRGSGGISSRYWICVSLSFTSPQLVPMLRTGVPARHTHAQSSVHRPPHVMYNFVCTRLHRSRSGVARKQVTLGSWRSYYAAGWF